MIRYNLDIWLALIVVLCLGVLIGHWAWPRPRIVVDHIQMQTKTVTVQNPADKMLMAENSALRAQIALDHAAARRIPAKAKVCGDNVADWMNVGVSEEFKAACHLIPK